MQKRLYSHPIHISGITIVFQDITGYTLLKIKKEHLKIILTA